jgi:hypothetical protein
MRPAEKTCGQRKKHAASGKNIQPAEKTYGRRKKYAAGGKNMLPSKSKEAFWAYKLQLKSP